MKRIAMKKVAIIPAMAALMTGCMGRGMEAEEYNAHIRQADSLYMAGNYVAANESFAKAFEGEEHIQDYHLYNGACVAALAGDADGAFERLGMRMKRDKEWYVEDPMSDNDLKVLHEDERWAEYVAAMSERKERIERNYDKPLRAKLKEIARQDQDVRYAYIGALQSGDKEAADSLLKQMQYVDSVNHSEVCDVLDSRGWVGRDVIGDVCEVFWLIIQHAPLESQKRYLPLFHAAVERGELDASAVAMMEDRVAVFEGRPQKYGSQVEQDEDGRYVPFELLDATKVDEWRAEVGMGPLEEYLKDMNSSR